MYKQYNKKIIEWLKDNKDKYENREDITNALNKELNLNLPVSKVNYLNNHYKLNLNRMSYDNPKIKDKLKIGWEKSRGTRLDNVKVGDEVTMTDRGGTWIKVSNEPIGRKGYIDKKRFLYETYHNVKLNHDEIIMHLNGNTSDYRKENLIKLDRTVQIRVIRNDFHKSKNEKLLARIKFCEWKEKINQLQGELK